jgi:Tfp pilus assembly protein PilF
VSALRWLRLLPVHMRMTAALARSDHARAVEAGERAVAIDPRDASTITLLAESYHELGADDRAMALWRRAIEIEPEHYGALRALGEHYAKNGEVELACAMLRRALAAERPPREAARIEKLVVPKKALDESRRVIAVDLQLWRAWAEKYLAANVN